MFLAEFSTPLLLQQLLKSMENLKSEKRVAMTYAALILLAQLIMTQSDVFALWYGRRCYERSRGEMTMMVYEKALVRKNAITVEEKVKVKGDTNPDATDDPNMHKSKTNPKYSIFSPKFWWNSNVSTTESKPPASMGKILNLIRGDVYEVAQRFWEVGDIVRRPLSLVLGVVLVWELLGPSCLVGISVVIAAQIVNAFITRILLRWEKRRRLAKDKRTNITSQFVESLRYLRYYGWQSHWLNQIMKAREHELYLRVATSLWSLLITCANSLGSNMFPVLALYAYTFLARHPLSIDIIFPALQLFNKLDRSLQEIPGLITSLLSAYIAVERLEDFLAESDRDETETDSTIDSASIQLIDCSFAWPGMQTPVLRDLNLTFSKGMNIICGKVGSGKTALLQAILGELDKLEGACRIPNEMIGYCAQTPWLQSMSIRDNILFSAPYEEDRYQQVLDVCALRSDLADFKHGDQSFIGENGIGLSGGQRARVALARAVYSRANILLLDDPISALDYTTAESIVSKCFDGPLMHGRTVILVTHRTELVSHLAEQVLLITEGLATLTTVDTMLDNSSSEDTSPKRVPSQDEEFEETKDQEPEGLPEKFMEEEHRAQWGVQTQVYWKYIKSGKLKWWALLIIALVVSRLMAIVRAWFLKTWGEAYNEVIKNFFLFAETGKSNSNGLLVSTGLNTTLDSSWLNPFTNFPPPQRDLHPWLVSYLVIGILMAVVESGTWAVMIVIEYFASKTLFAQVMARVSNATFRYYDVTPVGRLMNRLTSDIGTVDGNISNHFRGISLQVVTWVSSMIIIASVTPAFFAFALALSGFFIWIFFQFLPTSQSLRRLEMVSLSPLFANFGELLHGLTTVRAFHSEYRFQERVISVVDKFQGMDHFFWSTQTWLMYRYDSLAAISTFGLTFLALYTNVSPGLTAFVLTAASTFIQSTRYICRRYGQLQMDFVSVERIDELLRIEEEPEGVINPPASWPVFGSAIRFENATFRYAPHLEPSLIDISLQIPGGSTTAIVGRTGSGKSTLAIALLNVVRPENGSIIIDGLHIADVNVEILRSRVTFVAQDPILFAGTIRMNLDPTETYSDETCNTVLQRLCSRHKWTLQTNIEAGGRNLSQGQRQLIGLTRAVLRRSPIVIMDEATASIDYESSMEIQQILREEMVEATVIMIAHRVEAVKGADYAIVLEKGRVLRQGPAKEMLSGGLWGESSTEH
jgi:ABC-type multidrug transport system fused ATPase/permease subunit